MGEIDAAGEAMTGALLARAIEPRSGQMAGDHPDGLCLNCGTALIGEHCHRCGQAAHVHRTIGAIGHEILHGVVHFEGKLWRTLPMLAFRPGELTRRYIAGERARFVSPMALFLFSVFAMFAVFSLVGLSPPTDITNDVGIRAGIEQTQLRLVERRREAIKERNQLPANDPRRARFDREIAEYERDYRELTEMVPIVTARASNGRIVNGLKTGWERLDKGIEKANENPGLALYKLQANSYKFSWALIPLSLPFVWIMFAWRRRFRGYDHAVFVTYSIAFMSMLYTLLSVLSALGLPDSWTVGIGTFAPLAHIFFQLRGAYQSSWLRAALRTIFLSLMIVSFIIPLFVVMLLLLGLLG